MPGVPPDAVAQVKKGLRSLFSRRKSKQGQQAQHEPATTSQSASAGTSGAAAAAPAAPALGSKEAPNTDSSTDPSAPQPASVDPDKAPQLSEPSRTELAKDIDLNPAASDVRTQPSVGSAVATEPSASKTEPLEPSTEKTDAPTSGTETSTNPTESAPKSMEPSGMSATSGPLGDHMEEGFIDDDGPGVGPKGETSPGVEKEDQAENIAERAKPEQSEKA